MDIRKTVILIEDTLVDGGARLDQPLRRVALIAVVRNPLVARDDENLGELIRDGEDLGRFLAQRALEYVDRSRLIAVGKGAIVGSDGEPEHGQAILYPKFATAVREVLDLGTIPLLGEKKIGSASTSLLVPLHATAPASGSAAAPLPTTSPMEIRVPGSPRGDEILVALLVAGASK
jgi:Amino acid synthesis